MMPNDDPLADLLAGTAPPSAALRRDVFARTTGVLRRRRLVRRAGRVVALATGLVAVLYLTSPPAPPPPVEVVVGHPPPPASEPTAVVYRRAADRYLDEERDPLAALHCYGQALDAGTEDDNAFSPDDNWLLMALKNAREKEKRDANKGS